MVAPRLPRDAIRPRRALRVALALALSACTTPRAPLATEAAPLRRDEPAAAPVAAGGPVAAPGAAPASGAAPDAPAALPEDDEDEEGPDDEGAGEVPPDAVVRPAHPLAGVSDAELDRRLGEAPRSLGSMSIGRPNGGLLFNGVPMPEGEEWTIVAPGESYGTTETIEYLETAIRAVSRQYPGSQKLSIGDISARGGGYLRPHLSHQSGRDVDISYFYTVPSRWYARATAENLDRERTWAFVRALITLTDVDLLLIDHTIQGWLREYAESIGEDPEWLETVFHGSGRVPPIIRHAPGHATHLHIRFYNPIAQETGRRCYAALVRRGLVKVGAAYVSVVAKKGDTLIRLAKRYGTTPRAIRRANKLRSTLIQARKAYRIPQPGRAPPSVVSGPVAIPPRRLPPPRHEPPNPSAS